jgi:murein DD-endopeptidase MepM/ murein hydrolase activator NlpD
MNRRFLATLALVLALGAVTLAVVLRDLHAARGEFVRQVALARQEAGRIRNKAVLYSRERIARGVTLSETLADLGVEPDAAAGIIGSAQGVFDLRHIRAGHLLEVGRSVGGELRAVRYQIDGDSMLSVRSDHDGFQAEVKTIPSQVEVTTVRGKVEDSLFNAVEDAGENPELAMRLAEIFGWDLDFYTDPRQGDTFRVAVEKKTYLDGKPAGYGRILAAEYVNDGHPYRAILFRDPSGAPAYYAADGKSLQKAFLRSPLKFAAPITSHFSLHRYHPILKRYLPHLGVDYGAPEGTPVQAIGNGRVIFAARKGGDGNMVKIQHANGYQSMYLHLSRILVHVGQRVTAGDRIGLVGMTGLATGPHLDFRILDHGFFLNFETLRLHLPPAKPVAPAERAEFAAVRDRAMTELGEGTLEARSGAGTAINTPSAAIPGQR